VNESRIEKIVGCSSKEFEFREVESQRTERVQRVYSLTRYAVRSSETAIVLKQGAAVAEKVRSYPRVERAQRGEADWELRRERGKERGWIRSLGAKVVDEKVASKVKRERGEERPTTRKSSPLTKRGRLA
jgi:hypothetical protein